MHEEHVHWLVWGGSKVVVVEVVENWKWWLCYLNRSRRSTEELVELRMVMTELPDVKGVVVNALDRS